MVLHTWGQKLEHHPHVHCVVPGGGLAVPTPAPGATATESAAQAPRWVSCRPDWFLPVLVLSPVFRGKYLAALRQAYHAGELQFAGSTAPLASPQAWRTLVRTLYQKEWVVYAKEPFGGPEQVLKYLTGYTHRVALSNRRLVKLQDDRVTFTWKDYANGCARTEMTLDAWEFVRRFALHIVPKGLVRIRRFGLLAHRDRGERLALCRSLLAAPAEAAWVGDTVTEPPRPSGLSSEDAPATSCAVPVPPTVQPQPASATRIGVAVLALLTSLVVSSGDISWLPSLDVIRNKGYNSRMMTYATLQSDRREFLALTGLTLQEFQLLLNAFTPAYERRYPKDRTLADRPRQRCAGGGRKGVLDSPEQKLLFLLVYLKTYPLQVLMGELFGLSQPGVNYWFHRLLPVLRDALDSLGVLPERNPNDFAQSQTATGTEPRLIIDGTERRRQRPKSPEKQALHYSGKKKAHTDKNVVIVDLRRKCIGFLSRTYVGKTHDKKIADSEGISYPPKAELYKDTGFQGYEPAVTRTCQAKKKAAPRGAHSR